MKRKFTFIFYFVKEILHLAHDHVSGVSRFDEISRILDDRFSEIGIIAYPPYCISEVVCSVCNEQVFTNSLTSIP